MQGVVPPLLSLRFTSLLLVVMINVVEVFLVVVGMDVVAKEDQIISLQVADTPLLVHLQILSTSTITVQLVKSVTNLAM